MNQQNFTEFKRRLQERIDRIISQASLDILLFGPGMRSGQMDKRTQIRDELQRRYPKLNIYFCEDFPELNERYGLSLSEGAQGEIADFIIVLNTTPGPLAEIYEFGTKFYDKTYVLVNRRHIEEGGFPAKYIQYFSRHYEFTDEEYTRCDLATRVCPECVGYHLWQQHLRHRVENSNLDIPAKFS